MRQNYIQMYSSIENVQYGILDYIFFCWIWAAGREKNYCGDTIVK